MDTAGVAHRKRDPSTTETFYGYADRATLPLDLGYGRLLVLVTRGVGESGAGPRPAGKQAQARVLPPAAEVTTPASTAPQTPPEAPRRRRWWQRMFRGIA